jgi:hypothetical protein
MKDFMINPNSGKLGGITGDTPEAYANASKAFSFFKDKYSSASSTLKGWGRSAASNFLSITDKLGEGIASTAKGLFTDPRKTLSGLYDKVMGGIESFFGSLMFALNSVVAKFLTYVKSLQSSIDASAAAIGTQVQQARIPSVPLPTPTPAATPTKGAEEKPLPHTQFPPTNASHPGVRRAVTHRAVGDYIAGILQDTLQREMAASGTNRAHSSVTRPPHQR